MRALFLLFASCALHTSADTTPRNKNRSSVPLKERLDRHAKAFPAATDRPHLTAHHEFDFLKVDRGGAPQTSMKTDEVLAIIHPNELYTIEVLEHGSDQRARLVPTQTEKIQVTSNPSWNVEFQGTPTSIQVPDTVEPPDRATLDVSWGLQPSHASNIGNILGDNSVAIIAGDATPRVTIPGVEATRENLAYYNAILVGPGDVLKFDFPDNDPPSGTQHSKVGLPLFSMEVGDNYVETTLKNPKVGGGVYMEYHDLPHFHMPRYPRDSINGGYLLLGKFVEEPHPNSNGLVPLPHSGKIEVTAFRIPFGFGIYTKPEVLHCDGFLKGALEVVYSNANRFSTCTLFARSQEGMEMRYADVVVAEDK